MLKLVLLLAIVAVIVLAVRRIIRSLRAPAPPTTGDASPSAGSPQAKLVRCGSCGTLVPEEGAVAVTDGYRCNGCAQRG